MWHHGVLVIATTQLNSTKPKPSFCEGSNSACSMSKIRNGEDL